MNANLAALQSAVTGIDPVPPLSPLPGPPPAGGREQKDLCLG